jgi:hypothetical protein
LPWQESTTLDILNAPFSTACFYEVDPLVCPECGGRTKIIAFITDYSVLDRIINHLKLRFIADKPPPPRIALQEVLMAAQAGSEYFS